MSTEQTSTGPEWGFRVTINAVARDPLLPYTDQDTIEVSVTGDDVAALADQAVACMRRAMDQSTA